MAYPPSVPPASRTDSTPQATNHPGDHNAVSRALTDIINELGSNPSGPQGTVQQRVTNLENQKANLSGATFTGSVRMTAGGDVSLTSTGHALQTGVSSGVNLAMDGNEIQARNNGAKSSLILNQGGGEVFCGDNLRVASGASIAAGRIVLNEDGSGDFAAETLFRQGLTSNAAIIVGGDPASEQAGVRVNAGGSLNVKRTSGDPVLLLTFAGTAAAQGGLRYIKFANTNDETQTGSITKNGGGVTYGSNSDHRLKENLGPITDALVRIKQLAALAFRGEWITDQGQGKQWDMLYAHDTAVAADYAVIGAKDAVDGDGNPVYQQVDYSSMVPLLVAAIGELAARVEALETGG